MTLLEQVRRCRELAKASASLPAGSSIEAQQALNALDLAALEAALVDAERWNALCNLWAASAELSLSQDEEGTWSITQCEPVEEITFKPLIGETPAAAIDKARAK